MFRLCKRYNKEMHIKKKNDKLKLNKTKRHNGYNNEIKDVKWGYLYNVI